jgi:CheY-like chemotaxis protein
MTLFGKRILIAEDEYLIALALASEVAASGARVVGPVGGVDAALNIINTVDLDGAILDIDLKGQPTFLVTDALAARHIPFVFGTGYIRACDAPARHAQVPCLQKPFAPGVVCRALEGVMRKMRA